MNEVAINTESNFFAMLIGNKTDLENKRTVSTLEAKNWAKDMDFKFFETSAKTNKGKFVNEAFESIIEEIAVKVVTTEREEFKQELQREREDTIQFDLVPLKEDKKCC